MGEDETKAVQEFMTKKAKQIFDDISGELSMVRILGGAQKHTYLATTQNEFKFVIYIWDQSTSYFSYDEEKDIFLSSSVKLFELNNKKMSELGVRVPKLYYMDRSKNEQQYAYAFVEYIDGVDMDTIIAKEPERLGAVLQSLRKNISKLHQIKNETVGKLEHLQSKDFNIIDFSLEGAKKNITYLMEMDEENKTLYLIIEKKIYELAKGMIPRNEYTFIHGELGPNHVMVNENNEAVLIDIEGAKYVDIEEEVSFLKIRFNEYYADIHNSTVDEKRMKFYHICHCLGNLSGAIELKAKGYYDMDDINGMIVYLTSELKRIKDE